MKVEESFVLIALELLVTVEFIDEQKCKPLPITQLKISPYSKLENSPIIDYTIWLSPETPTTNT